MVFLGVPALLLTNVGEIGSVLSVIQTVRTQSLFSLSDETVRQGIMAGVAQAANDPYTAYYTPEQWAQLSSQLNYEVYGIGIQLIDLEDGDIAILPPLKGSPAEKAGIKNNDRIQFIDGKSTAEMHSEEVVQLIQGEVGTVVSIGVYRPDEARAYEFSIKRKRIQMPTVESAELENAPEIGYIRLHQFTADSDDDMAEALEQWKEKRGLILDLRDNPGGDLHAALKIADQFLESGTIIKTVDVKGNETVYEAHSDSTALPLVILINGNSASSSEVLAAALHDNQRAVLVGEKSFGKGIIQSVLPLRNGGVLKLTTEQYQTPDGINIHKIGIEPDYSVAAAEDSQSDVQLEKAVEILRKEIQQ